MSFLSRQYSPALSGIAIVLILVSTVIWGVKGASLFVSIMTVKDALMQIADYLNAPSYYAQFMMMLVLIGLMISELMKPTFQIKGWPKWASILVLVALMATVIAVPATGIGFLMQQLAALILAVFMPALQMLGRGATTAIAGVAAAIFVYVVLVRVLLSKLMSSGYNMWTAGLFASGTGYVVGLILGSFAIMLVRMALQFMASGTLLFLILGLLLVGTAIHESLEQGLKLGPQDLAQLPAAIVMALALRSSIASAYPDAAWLLDVMIYTMLSVGIGALVWGVLFRNKNMYVAGCAFSASLLAMMSILTQAVTGTATPPAYL